MLHPVKEIADISAILILDYFEGFQTSGGMRCHSDSRVKAEL
jgi:hypothetical protein